MKITIGQKICINGQVKTVKELLMPGGVIITTDGGEYFAGWDVIEPAQPVYINKNGETVYA